MESETTLGSMNKCPNCHATSFRRIKINRTVQCERCNLIVEERCPSDLFEFHAVTQTEEVYCAVTPDFLHAHVVDDIPDDPYCTPGFISAFRMLSPLREPVYAASARTLNGRLAEMERLIGDALFAGYVGYNGRAPGGTVIKKEELVEPNERNRYGGDARHTLVAYFEIVELASILCADRETTNLAIRIFRHTASNTSLRNRNVESLATAAFVSAAERRWQDYQEWLQTRSGVVKQEQLPFDPGDQPDASNDTLSWPIPPRQLSVEQISAAANLDTSEVLRYLKVVNIALRKQQSESDSSVTSHMPSFCRTLELPQRTQNLAISIAENAMQNNICSRRNPVSISAAAIYLACQLDGVRKTQTEICRATSLTEVTLRKVYKELNREQAALLPSWYNHEPNDGLNGNSRDSIVAGASAENADEDHERRRDDGVNIPDETPPNNPPLAQASKQVTDSLTPPPLPPGFGDTSTRKGVEKRDGNSSPKSEPAEASRSDAPQENSNNALLNMMNNPAMQAFAKAFSIMPQLMMPPPPPPLPPTMTTSRNPQSPANPVRINNHAPPKEVKDITAPQRKERDSTGQDSDSVAATQPPVNAVAGMQSMLGMMQALQTFQSMQPGSSGAGEIQANPEDRNPWAMMANLMVQTQVTGSNSGGREADRAPPAQLPPSASSGTATIPKAPETPDVPKGEDVKPEKEESFDKG